MHHIIPNRDCRQILFLLCSAMFVLSLALPAMAKEIKSTVIHEVRFGIHEDFTRFVFVCRGGPPTWLGTEAPDRFQVTFDSLEMAAAPEQLAEYSPPGLKESISRLTFKQGRLSLDIGLQAERFHPFILQDRRGRPDFYRLVIDLYPSENGQSKGVFSKIALVGSQARAPAKQQQAEKPGVDKELDKPEVLTSSKAEGFQGKAIDSGQEIVLFDASTEATQEESEQAVPPDRPQSWWDVEGLDFSGFANLYGANDLHSDPGNEDERAFRNRVRAELKYMLPMLDSAGDSGLKAGKSYAVLSGESDYLWFGPDDSQDDYDLEIYEAFLNLGQGPLQIRLGKQTARWGKTDQISPVDALNPQDMRLFTLQNRDERVLPNWMLRTRLFLDNLTVEGVYIPFFLENEIDYFGTDWSVFEHVKEDILDSGFLSAQQKQYFRRLGVEEREPANTLENGSLGARIGTTLGNVDLSLSYLYGYDPMPHFVSFPVKNISLDGSINAESLQRQLARATLTPGDIEVEYLRSHMAGIEFESTLGDFGLRGEAAYFDSRTFLTDSLTSTDRASVFGVLGVDYLGRDQWYANIQIMNQHIVDYRDDILYFERNNWAVTSELSKELFRGRAELGVEGVYFLSDQSFSVNPWLVMELVPAFDVELGLNLFEGDEDTLLGRYDPYDQGYVKLSYHF